MPDYSNGKIYTIRCRTDETLIYVGSTIQPLFKRFYKHKRDKLCSLYQYVNKFNLDWDEWYIELYENYPCKSKEELNRQEGKIIREIATINQRVEGRTRKEYRIENADKIKSIKNNYRIENADKIKERGKTYYIENAEKFKQYYIENIDKIKTYKKEYQKEYSANQRIIKFLNLIK